VIERAWAHIKEGEPCDDVPLDLRGTPFQLRVWNALREIPRGRTTTYGAIAAGLGLAPVAARAVGAACGANPVGLIVPCHRVVAASGGLGGYYWGLDRKQALLEWEGAGRFE
jgi:O-6-methylguanine DNA methyltransferase